MKLYKCNYIIAIYEYEDDEELVGVFDNVEEVSKALRIRSMSSLSVKLSRIFHKKQSSMCHGEKRYRVYFYEYSEKED